MELSVAIVEDDPDLRSTLARGLREEGYTVVAAATGAEGVELISAEPPAGIVMDIGLPDADGRDVCQALRVRGVAAPVLFLTARDALTDRLSGFHAGGDDYLTKPFHFDELVVRLQALMRRSAGVAGDLTGLRLDPTTHSIRNGGRNLPLTPTEFRIVAALAARPGEVVRRRELIASAWPHGAMVRDNTLDTYLKRLRRKLASVDRGDAVTTVHGVGYRYDP
jgi:two-component system OmpR family response regulator